VLELDGRSADPMRTIRQRFAVAKGPTGIAVANKENAAVVYSQFDEELAVVKLDDSPGYRVHLDGGTSHLDDVGAAGRETFYRSDDPRITAEGLACSSCHPDGTEDGITWSTPEGLRQTPMLAGRLKGTEPYGWTRNQDTLEAYITDTCTRLGGSGLGQGELTELASYIRELPSPPQSAYSAPEAARGREVFMAQQCDQCHMAGNSTDKKSYDFEGDNQKYDTPSLKNIGLTAPYFHDGRYKTLDELLADPNNKMGNVARIPEKDRAPLRAYLESL
jgi:cytochrome c peroxidase